MTQLHGNKKKKISVTVINQAKVKRLYAIKIVAVALVVIL